MLIHEPYRVLICGSRDYSKRKAIEGVIDAMKEVHGERLVIIAGGARGADAIAEQAARLKGVKVVVVKADWSRGRSAGIIRNNLMLDMQPNEVVAFWDGQSKGTEHTISEAQRCKIPVTIYGDG